ncbi:MAG: glycerol-3-phosphate 1-O-acyltransferase PlsY [Nitrospirae bacterium]|nr:glycerol-3-phosphate 1-O-acyltransferase PlsY [Nitrospirota bacterium]
MSGASLCLFVLLSYLTGSIPFGVIISRRKGIDLRSIGSGNIGATNVLRGAGKLAAFFTLAGDILKGVLPLLILHILFEGKEARFNLWGGAAGLAAVIGHLFPVFLSFRGGKGVATGLGVMLVYSPVTLAVMAAVWLCTAVISRYSSLSSIIAYITMPAVMAFAGEPALKILFGAALALLIISKHAPNIKRLADGTEHKIGGMK